MEVKERCPGSIMDILGKNMFWAAVKHMYNWFLSIYGNGAQTSNEKFEYLPISVVVLIVKPSNDWKLLYWHQVLTEFLTSVFRPEDMKQLS